MVVNFAADHRSSPKRCAANEFLQRFADNILVGLLVLHDHNDLNLCSAFAHVLADTLRTLTVMSCALLVSLGGLDGDRTDAIGSLVVCVVITVVAAFVGYETLVECRRLRVTSPARVTVGVASAARAEDDELEAGPTAAHDAVADEGGGRPSATLSKDDALPADPDPDL